MWFDRHLLRLKSFERVISVSFRFQFFFSLSFKPAGEVLAGLSACLNSSVLCACPQVNIIEGLEVLLMSPVCFLSKSPCSSSISLAFPCAYFISLVSCSPLPHPHSLFSSVPLPSSSLYTVHHLKRWGCWALEGNKSDLWMVQPTWVLEGEASGSQALWFSGPLFLQPHCSGSSSSSPYSDFILCFIGATYYL